MECREERAWRSLVKEWIDFSFEFKWNHEDRQPSPFLLSFLWPYVVTSTNCTSINLMKLWLKRSRLGSDGGQQLYVIVWYPYASLCWKIIYRWHLSIWQQFCLKMSTIVAEQKQRRQRGERRKLSMNQRYQYLNHSAGFQEEDWDIPWEDAKEQQIKTRRA